MKAFKNRWGRGFGRYLPALAAALLLAALVAGCGARSTPTPTADGEPGIPFPEVPRISVEEAAALQAAGAALFVDVRGAQYYAEGHIAGSVSLPLASIESEGKSLPKSPLVITVCT